MGQPPLDPRAVRMLTRHYYNLQGLRMVPLALLYQLAASTWLGSGSELRMYGAAAAGLAVLAVPMLIIERYYRSFGRVLQSQRSSIRAGIFVAGSVLFLRSQGHWLPQVPNLICLAVAGYLAWLAWDCRPFRWHVLLLAAAATYIAFGSVGQQGDDLGWMASRWWALTTADLIVAPLDHLLFVRVMPGRRADIPLEDHRADTI